MDGADNEFRQQLLQNANVWGKRPQSLASPELNQNETILTRESLLHGNCSNWILSKFDSHHTGDPEHPFPMMVAEVPAWHSLNHHVLLLNTFSRRTQRTQRRQPLSRDPCM